jgi:hypothetical protein
MRLPDRWIPIFAAAVGVLGGMGGALVGGYISNQGQEQQFENQREAAKDDLRQDAYANFLQEGFSYLLQVQLKAAGLPVTGEELKARSQALAGAEAAVALFGNTELAVLADQLLNDLVREQVDDATTHLKDFQDLAKEDIASPNR